jgi:hypothetical protein
MSEEQRMQPDVMVSSTSVRWQFVLSIMAHMTPIMKREETITSGCTSVVSHKQLS